MRGFPPSIDWRDIRQYTQFLRIFSTQYLDELVRIFIANKPASVFTKRLLNTVTVSASHSRRGMRGWKNRKFAVSLMMLDLVEVFKDFYDPKDFVEFGSGALRGQKVMSYTDDEKKNNKHPKGYAHRRGLVLYNRMIKHMLENRKWVPFLGCEVVGRKIVNKLTKQPLHYGDIADQFACETQRTFQWTSGSWLHNEGTTTNGYEFPLWIQTNCSPENVWPEEVNRVQASILDRVKTNVRDIPPLAPSFSVMNEEEWRDYCSGEGEKKEYGGWYDSTGYIELH